MKNNQENCQIIYRPILFIIGTFIISWICAGLMARINYSSHVALFTFLDFKTLLRFSAHLFFLENILLERNCYLISFWGRPIKPPTTQ